MHLFMILQGSLGSMTVHFIYTHDSSMYALCPLFYGWELEAHPVMFPKEFREVAYSFVCVFCSVLHIFFYIKVTEAEYLGLVEILLKTFL